MNAPYLFLDVDGVLHGTHMKYGYERTCVVVERIPYADVHPANRPRQVGRDRGELPEWVARRRPTPTHITFRTPMRTSPRLREDLAALGADVRMLTTWLEHDAVDAFFAQTGDAPFPYTKLRFPGRDHGDPQGAIPERWKVDQVVATLDADPRPFIWVDDDETPMWRDEIEARYPQLPKLLIAPAYDIGLTRDHLAEMRDFMAAHAPA